MQCDCLCRKWKQPTKKLLRLTSEFSKVVGCKTNIQSSIIFLHTSNEQSKFEKEFFKLIASKYEILRYKTDKIYAKSITENYKMLPKEILKYLNRWRDISCSWVKMLNFVKCQLSSNRFHTIPI